MAEQHRNNFFKLVAVIVDVALLVIRKYIREKILGPDSFETFLNKEIHKLVHIFETSQCCKCMIENISRDRLISKKQLLILYKSDEKNQNKDHKKYAGNRVTQICICKYSAKKDIDVRVVDITLANYIIQKCGKHKLGIPTWIEQIKDVRNEIFHLSDVQEMTDHLFSIKWTKLEGSIMGIAKVIGSVCAEETEKDIKQIKQLTVKVPDYMLKYEIVCRDYWRNKCAEFQRAQNQVIEEKAATLHHIMPYQFRRLTKEDCQKTSRGIETLETMVNNINIMVNIFGIDENVEKVNDTEAVKEEIQIKCIPVFMQLEVPTSWDQTKIFDALDEVRLNGLPDTNIKIKAISMDDLNIFAEISNKLLRNVHKLRSDINIMMSTMLSEAAIDTTEEAKVYVNLEVPDVTENKPTTEEVFDQVRTPVKYNLPISVNLRLQFKIKQLWNKNLKVFNCVKIGNKLVSTDNENDQLIICNADGNNIRSIFLSCKPFYITAVDDNTVAVACIYNRTILVIDIATGSATTVINTNGFCYGISYRNNNLYVVIDQRIIHVMDLTGKVICNIPLPSEYIRDITVDRERFVCRDVRSIYCCSLDGTLMWQFKSKEYTELRRVTTDNEGYVYATNIYTKAILVVSDDGCRHREIVTELCELDHPIGLYFDKQENTLLICNRDKGKVFLFDIHRNVT